MKVAILLGVIPLALYTGACVLLYAKQRSLLFLPTPETSSTRAQAFQLESFGESLKIWCVNPDQPQAILYFGGNAEDVAQNIPEFLALFPRSTVYLANYRGYGGSSGQPTERGLFEDALALFDHVDSTYREISVIGRSLGTGVALHLATQRTIQRLVLVTPYDSIQALARNAFPFFPVGRLLKDPFRSIDRAPSIELPTLVLVAAEDQVIPRLHTERLVEAFHSKWVETIVIPESGHNTIGSHPEYRAALKRFLGSGADTSDDGVSEIEHQAKE